MKLHLTHTDNNLQKDTSRVYRKWNSLNNEIDIEFSDDNHRSELVRVYFGEKYDQLYKSLSFEQKIYLWKICKLYVKSGVFCSTNLIPSVSINEIVGDSDICFVKPLNDHIYQNFLYTKEIKNTVVAKCIIDIIKERNVIDFNNSINKEFINVVSNLFEINGFDSEIIANEVYNLTVNGNQFKVKVLEECEDSIMFDGIKLFDKSFDFLGENEEIFQHICKKMLISLSDVYPKIDSKSKNKTLIVESRWNESVEYSIKNTIQKMGDGWGHIIVCTNQNFNHIVKLKDNISQEIEVINLEEFKINRNSYNNLLYELTFWEKIKCEKVLIYQSDTFIFKKFDNSFLDWDYIGSPWGPSKHSRVLFENCKNMNTPIYLGNGGLSLRTVSAMKKILNQQSKNKESIKFNKTDCDYLWEDAFFSYYINISEEFKLSPVEVAKKFSFEHIYFDDTFGCHQPFVKSFSGDDVFKKFINKLNGVNVYGFGNTNSGLGHNMRVIIEALEYAKIPHNIRILNDGGNGYLEDDYQEYFKINLVLCNPDFNYSSFIGKNMSGKYNIALWAWESEKISEKWKESSKDFDEIWTISEFCKNAFESNLNNKKISTLNIPGNYKNKLDKIECKKKFKLENKFIVLYTFDAYSDLERKNPNGTIEAFKKYIGQKKNCLLILKTHNLSDDQMIFLKESIGDSKNIIIINESWSNEFMEILFNLADVYMSLHRSEGSGLTIMESIMLEIPVVCTGYSGNLDFCQSDKCQLVDFKMVKIGDNKYPGSFYSSFFDGGEIPNWADPSVDDAGKKLLQIYDNYDYYVDLIRSNKVYIKDKFSVENLSKNIEMLFYKIEFLGTNW